MAESGTRSGRTPRPSLALALLLALVLGALAMVAEGKSTTVGDDLRNVVVSPSSWIRVKQRSC